MSYNIRNIKVDYIPLILNQNPLCIQSPKKKIAKLFRVTGMSKSTQITDSLQPTATASSIYKTDCILKL